MPPSFAADQPQAAEPSPREAFMVMAGVLAGMKGVEEDKDLCPSQVLPLHRK
jgi:hypothetical protein